MIRYPTIGQKRCKIRHAACLSRMLVLPAKANARHGHVANFGFLMRHNIGFSCPAASTQRRMEFEPAFSVPGGLQGDNCNDLLYFRTLSARCRADASWTIRCP